MKYIFIALFIFFIAASVYAEEVSIDHAYLRKLSKNMIQVQYIYL